jgi:hypothetical protein
MGTTKSNCEDHYAIPRIGLLSADLPFAVSFDAADIYFGQTVACPCGYRNSSPYTVVV